MSGTCIVIDAEAQRRQLLASLLEFLEYDVIAAPDARGINDALGEGRIVRAAFIGACGSEQDQYDTWKTLRAASENLAVFTLSDPATPIATSREVVLGALGVLELPFKYERLHHALHQAEVYNESRGQERARRPQELFRSLVGNSRAIQRVRRMIEQVAGSEANVLILGESGVGKEVVARNLHYFSPRRGRPFVPINCGAIPAELLESELFGHEKGAFTGAVSARQGRFELAEGGTLFLDEIGDMSLGMQVKLLRVLQERTFERVGSNKSLTADVRIIAATHRNLEEAIREGKFREDLFYRLNVFPIEMPPLRERAEDIPLLVNELIQRIEHERRGSVRLSPQAVVALTQHSWPGNVRELANLIERLAILCPNGTVDVDDLPEKYHVPGMVPRRIAQSGAAMPANVVPFEPATNLPAEGMDLKEHLNHLEYSYIRQALDESGGVVAAAAKRLGLGRTTLVEKLRKYDLSPRATNDRVLTEESRHSV
jgi:sigma-54 specific flagellar transcriptional regulator A